MAVLNGLQKVVRRIIDAFNDVCISLRVGGPLHDDCIQAMVRLEVAAVPLSAYPYKSFMAVSLTEYLYEFVPHEPC